MTSGAPVPDLSEIVDFSGEEPCLMGGRCPECGQLTFPRQAGCPRCSHGLQEVLALSRRGRLWSFTVQSFPLKAPYVGPTGDDFIPFGVGYVELPEGIIAEARLTESDPAKLAIGMEVELKVVPFGPDLHASELVTYAFAPVHPVSTPTQSEDEAT